MCKGEAAGAEAEGCGSYTAEKLKHNALRGQTRCSRSQNRAEYCLDTHDNYETLAAAQPVNHERRQQQCAATISAGHKTQARVLIT